MVPRSLQNFDIGGPTERLPPPLIKAFGVPLEGDAENEVVTDSSHCIVKVRAVVKAVRNGSVQLESSIEPLQKRVGSLSGPFRASRHG